MNGMEPSDAIRVVNCLLTQIDKLRTRKNVLILATSNIEEAIDCAFLDRADLKIHIGCPSVEAAYNILSGCLTELMRAKIIQEKVIIDLTSTFSLYGVKWAFVRNLHFRKH